MPIFVTKEQPVMTLLRWVRTECLSIVRMISRQTIVRKQWSVYPVLTPGLSSTGHHIDTIALSSCDQLSRDIMQGNFLYFCKS